MTMEEPQYNEDDVYRHRFHLFFTKKEVRRRALLVNTPVANVITKDSEFRRFADLFKNRTLQPGEYLYEEGSDRDFFAVVAKGELSLTVDEQKINHFKLQREDIISEGIFSTHKSTTKSEEKQTNSPNTHNIIAETECELLYISRKNFESFTKRAKLETKEGFGTLVRTDFLESTYKLLGATETSNDNRKLLSSLFQYKQVKTDEIVYEQGKFEQALYVVLSGEINLKAKEDRKETKMLPGDYFGEFSLLTTNIPRITTATATQDSVLLRLEGMHFLMFLKHCPELRKNWKNSCSGHVKTRVAEQLKQLRAPFLMGFSEEDYQLLAQWTHLEHFAANYPVIKQDTDSNKFYMITYGEVEITVDEKIVNTMGKGEYFGEIGLVQQCKRTASVKTTQPCIMLTCNKKDFHELFTKIPSVAADFCARLIPHQMTIENVIYHRTAVDYFMLHLKNEYSAENLDFVLDVLDFKTKGQPSIPHIVDKYIKTQVINITELCKNNTLAKYQELLEKGVTFLNFDGSCDNFQINSSSSRSLFIDSDDADECTRIFDDAVKEIMRLMSTDSLQRFKRSDSFKDFLQSLYQYTRVSGSVMKRGNDASDARGRISNILGTDVRARDFKKRSLSPLSNLKETPSDGCKASPKTSKEKAGVESRSKDKLKSSKDKVKGANEKLNSSNENIKSSSLEKETGLSTSKSSENFLGIRFKKSKSSNSLLNADNDASKLKPKSAKAHDHLSPPPSNSSLNILPKRAVSDKPPQRSPSQRLKSKLVTKMSFSKSTHPAKPFSSVTEHTQEISV